MPHDANGDLLEVGDRVLIPCFVKFIAKDNEYCNIILVTIHPMYPYTNDHELSLNAKQVLKARSVTHEDKIFKRERVDDIK